MNVYLIGSGTDPDHLTEVASNLLKRGLGISHIAYWYPRHAGETRDLRGSLRALTEATTVVLIDDWWQTSEGHMLQTVAAWLRMDVLDEDGNPVPTSSLRG